MAIQQITWRPWLATLMPTLISFSQSIENELG
jgi:hypothetical protein